VPRIAVLNVEDAPRILPKQDVLHYHGTAWTASSTRNVVAADGRWKRLDAEEMEWLGEVLTDSTLNEIAADIHGQWLLESNL